MDAAARARLEAAYRDTEYRVCLPAGELLLQVDRHEATADLRLREEAGVSSHWAIVTPCNPASQPLSAEENRQRLDEFGRILRTLGVRHVVSLNRDVQGEWPDEPGFLLCDPLPGQAGQLGRRFGQNAILQGRLGGAPQLAWLID